MKETDYGELKKVGNSRYVLQQLQKHDHHVVCVCNVECGKFLCQRKSAGIWTEHRDETVQTDIWGQFR